MGVGYLYFPGRDYSWDNDSVCLYLGFDTLKFPLFFCLIFMGFWVI